MSEGERERKSELKGKRFRKGEDTSIHPEKTHLSNFSLKILCLYILFQYVRHALSHLTDAVSQKRGQLPCTELNGRRDKGLMWLVNNGKKIKE